MDWKANNTISYTYKILCVLGGKMKKRIDTVLEEDLWREAQFANIRWSEAIELGIKILLDSENEDKRLAKKQKELEGELKFINEKREKLAKQQQHDKETEKDVHDNIGLLATGAKRYFKNPDIIKGWIKVWFRKTGKMLSKNELIELFERYRKGEFNVKKKEAIK